MASSCLWLRRYDNLQTVSLYFPAATNRHGSYLTAFSDGGLQLSVITTLTGYSQVHLICSALVLCMHA